MRQTRLRKRATTLARLAPGGNWIKFNWQLIKRPTRRVPQGPPSVSSQKVAIKSCRAWNSISIVPVFSFPRSPPSPLAVQSRLFHLLKGFSWTNNEYSVQVVDLCLGAAASKVFKVRSSVRVAVKDSHHYLRRISIESIPQRVLVLVSVVAENQWYFSRVSPWTGQAGH